MRTIDLSSLTEISENDADMLNEEQLSQIEAAIADYAGSDSNLIKFKEKWREQGLSRDLIATFFSENAAIDLVDEETVDANGDVVN